MALSLVGVEAVRQAITEIKAAQMEFNTASAETESAKALIDELSGAHAKAVEIQTRAERALALSGGMPDDKSCEEEAVESWARKLRVARHRLSFAEEALASHAELLAGAEARAKAAWLAFGLENGAEMSKAFFEASVALRKVVADWRFLAEAFPSGATYGSMHQQFVIPETTIGIPDPDYPSWSIMARLAPNIPEWWGKYRGPVSAEFAALLDEVKAVGVLG